MPKFTKTLILSNGPSKLEVQAKVDADAYDEFTVESLILPKDTGKQDLKAFLDEDEVNEAIAEALEGEFDDEDGEEE
jgi:hypothetical protein